MSFSTLGALSQKLLSNPGIFTVEVVAWTAEASDIADEGGAVVVSGFRLAKRAIPPILSDDGCSVLLFWIDRVDADDRNQHTASKNIKHKAMRCFLRNHFQMWYPSEQDSQMPALLQNRTVSVYSLCVNYYGTLSRGGCQGDSYGTRTIRSSVLLPGLKPHNSFCFSLSITMADHPPIEDSMEGSSSLDHVLLESLFYNEFALMDQSSDPLLVLPSLDLACATAVAPSDSIPAGAEIPAADSAPIAGGNFSSTSHDPSVRVEKDLLRDFGVTSSPAIKMEPCAFKAPVNLPPLPFVPPAPDVEQQVRNQIASCNRGIRHNVAVAPAPLPARVQPPPKSPQPTEEEKRKKLVSQFATLANRLGITLPPPVLQKLTMQATSAGGFHSRSTDATTQSLQVEAPISASTGNLSPTVSFNDSSQPPAEETTAPAIQQIRSTAAEAIASVSNKRTAVDDNRPYSKRRKKPRLPDCERKLTELKAENELLKRHLDNISNKSMALEKERIAAEQKMRVMLQTNAPDHELESLVKNFSEMYSDYGRKRHEELNFHLEQLQRYVTLSQSSRIASIHESYLALNSTTKFCNLQAGEPDQFYQDGTMDPSRSKQQKWSQSHSRDAAEGIRDLCSTRTENP